MGQKNLTARILADTWNLSLSEVQALFQYCNIVIAPDEVLTKEQRLTLKTTATELKKSQLAEKERLEQQTKVPTSNTSASSASSTSTLEATVKASSDYNPLRKVGDIAPSTSHTKKQQMETTVAEQQSANYLDNDIEDIFDDEEDIIGINTFFKQNMQSALEKFKNKFKNK